MKLRWQVFVVLLVPVVLALAVAGGIVAVYLKVYYADSIKTSSEDMKKDQEQVLEQISSLISRLGSSALQGKINPMLLSSRILRQQTEADLKPTWTEASNAVNGVLLSRWLKGETSLSSIPDWDSATNRSNYFAMWGIGSRNLTLESLNKTSREHMRWAASFDYLSQSMMRLVFTNQAHFSFESDGFFYYIPAVFKSYFYSPKAAGYLASKCPRTLGEDRYDPRCRPFYVEVAAAGPTDWVVLVTTYLLGEKKTIAQGVCAPLWTGLQLNSMHCLNFDLLDLMNWLKTVKIGSAGYAYLVTRKGLPYIHPKLNESWTDDPPNIFQLEFSDDIYYQNVSMIRANYENNSNIPAIKAEIDYYNETILPQMKGGTQNITSYSRLGETYIACLTPLSLRFSMQNTTNYLSVAVVMEITQFTALYNTLITKGEDFVTNAGIALGVVFFVILVLGLILAFWLSHFMLRTLREIIKHINGLLARDFHRYIKPRDVVIEDAKVMYDLLRFMKHITQYNSTKEAELHELIAVLKDLDDFKEVQEFLTCCQRIALKCLETQNYSESVEICMLFTCALDNPKKVSKLKCEPAVLQALINLLDLLALSLLEVRNSLETTKVEKIREGLEKLRSELKDDTKIEAKLRYLDWVMRESEALEREEEPLLQELQDQYVRKLQELKQTREKAATESYRRVVFGMEYGTLMKGKTIENVLSLAIHIVEKLEPKDMFGFLRYTDRTEVSLSTGSLDHKLAFIRALERFNQPQGEADFYIGLLGGLKELARKRPHATSHLYFKHKQPIQRECFVLVTTGLLLDTSREAEALQGLNQYSGELLVLWLRSEKEKCVQGFECIQALLEQWVLAETNLVIIEARNSAEAMLQSQVYQQLGLI